MRSAIKFRRAIFLLSAMAMPALMASPMFLSRPVYAISNTSHDQPVTAFVDTRLVDPRYGNTVRARINSVSLANLSTIQLRTEDGASLLPSDGDTPIEVTVILPKGMNPLDEEVFVAEIQRALNHRFITPVFSVRRSYLPPTFPKPVSSKQAKASIETLSTYERWRHWTAQTAHAIRMGSYEPEKVDLFFGSFIGQVRTVAGAGYWLTVSGWNGYGATQAFLTFALNQIFSLFPMQINTWKVEHEIPIFKDFPLVTFYNRHPYVKTVSINELMAFTFQSLFRWLSHLARPATIAGPLTLEFLAPFFGMSAIRTPLGAAEDIGVLTLLKKGQINRRTAHYMANLLGLESLLSGLLFSSGQMQLLPLALGLEWSSKLAVWVISIIVPAKDNRLIVVHPDVSKKDLDQIEYVYDLRDLPLDGKNIETSTLSDLLSKYHLEDREGSPSIEIIPGAP